MFPVKRKWGHHQILRHDTEKYSFRRFLEELYGERNLESLHLQSEEYKQYVDGKIPGLENVETDLQKKFYTEIKTNPTFKRMYCQLIMDIQQEFFPNDACLIYQSFPSIRFQFPNNIAVPAHCDSDDLGRHPAGEKNFLLPITAMKDSTRLFIESEPGKKDFEGVNLDYGDLLYFNGNKCVHYNQANTENYLRISFDFRILTRQDYIHYIETSSVTSTNPRDLLKERVPVRMIVGGYYQCMFKGSSLEKNMYWFSNKDFIMQTRPHVGEEERAAVNQYLSSGDPFLTEFKETTKLEQSLTKFIGAKHCFMTTSGSTALVVALLACEIGPGDEVIVPDYTMIATVNAVKLLGAKPILVDVDAETFTLSLSGIQAALTSKTKAIIHVSLNNRSKDLECIATYCKENGLFLIEDAAQSLGCKWKGQHYGTFGDIGCFSLSTPKIITTGQGGFVVTNNDSLAHKMFCIKNFGRATGGIEQYDMFGLNFKFTDLQAVVGQAQLTKLSERILTMRRIFDSYYFGLQHIRECRMIPPQSDEWIPWFVEVFHANRDKLSYFLKQHNIGTRQTYPSIHSTAPYCEVWNAYADKFVQTNFVSNNGLFLPSHVGLTDEQIAYICCVISIFN